MTNIPRKARFKNPWALDEAPEPDGNVVADSAVVTEPPKGRDIVDPNTGAVLEPPKIDVVVPSYGGFQVTHAGNATEALLKVLDVVVKHQESLDDAAVQHGVLIAKLPDPPKQGYYVHRNWDGWTLSVPGALNRDQALLQVVQMLLEIDRGPRRNLLVNAGIRPYRQ